MYRKIKRCLCFLFSLLTILIAVVSVGADPPLMMSPGVGPNVDGGGGFVSAPSSIDISFYDASGNSYVGFSVDPLISVKQPVGESVSGVTSATYYDPYYDYYYLSEVSYDIFSYDYHSDIVLNSDGSPVSGEVRVDSNYYFTAMYNTPSSVKFTIRDFYSWTDPTDPLSVFAQFDSNSNVRFSVSNDLDSYFTFENALIYYSEFGSDVVKTLYVGAGQNGKFDRLDFHLEGSDLTEFDNFFQLFYIHSFEVTCLTSDPNNALQIPFVSSYCFYDGFRNRDINQAQHFDSDNPAVPLLNYTAFLGTAVSGFLDLQIFPNFTLGGILMTVIAFVLVIWFLKLFAGG